MKPRQKRDAQLLWLAFGEHDHAELEDSGNRRFRVGATTVFETLLDRWLRHELAVMRYAPGGGTELALLPKGRALRDHFKHDDVA